MRHTEVGRERNRERSERDIEREIARQREKGKAFKKITLLLWWER